MGSFTDTLTVAFEYYWLGIKEVASERIIITKHLIYELKRQYKYLCRMNKIDNQMSDNLEHGGLGRRLTKLQAQSQTGSKS